MMELSMGRPRSVVAVAPVTTVSGVMFMPNQMVKSSRERPCRGFGWNGSDGLLFDFRRVLNGASISWRVSL